MPTIWDQTSHLSFQHSSNTRLKSCVLQGRSQGSRFLYQQSLHLALVHPGPKSDLIIPATLPIPTSHFPTRGQHTLNKPSHGDSPARTPPPSTSVHSSSRHTQKEADLRKALPSLTPDAVTNLLLSQTSHFVAQPILELILWSRLALSA